MPTLLKLIKINYMEGRTYDIVNILRIGFLII